MIDYTAAASRAYAAWVAGGRRRDAARALSQALAGQQVAIRGTEVTVAWVTNAGPQGFSVTGKTAGGERLSGSWRPGQR